MTAGLSTADPTALGTYRLLGRLGGGGMGQVYLGKSPGGRLVAVKVIRSDLAADPEFRLRFAREVANAKNVSGMFTALVVDADTDGPVPWLATAYIPGPSLADAVRDSGPLPPATLLPLAAGLAEALVAIHTAGVVHRDLKPSNVLLAADGPRVIDFGISHAVEASTLTQPGAVMGSPGYMSPEQAQGLPVGPQSDVFSLGAVLAFAATGNGPFGGGSINARIYRVVHEPPALDLVPEELRPLIGRCLSKAPGARPSPNELLAAWGGEVIPADWLPDTVVDSLSRYGPTARLAALAASQPSAAATAAAAVEPAAPPAETPPPTAGEPERDHPGRGVPTTTVAPLNVPAVTEAVERLRTTGRTHRPWHGLTAADAWRKPWVLAAAALAVAVIAAAATLSIDPLGAHPAAAIFSPANTTEGSVPATQPDSTPTPTRRATSHPSAQAKTPTTQPTGRSTAATATPTPATSQASAPTTTPAPTTAITPAPARQPTSSTAATPTAHPSSTSSGPPVNSTGALTATNAATHSCAAYPSDGFASINGVAYELVNNTASTVYYYYTDLGAVIDTPGTIPPNSSVSSTLLLGGTYLVQDPIGTCIGYVTVDGTSGEITIS